MPESCAAAPEETAVKSPLDKPLHQLTEDDIAQVTREDCRRYLKEKGMRRPSWNKSQAIQQVIMLKTLLEATPDSDAGALKRLRISRPNTTDSSSNVALESVPRGTTGDADNSLSAEETTPPSVKDLDKPDSSSGHNSRFAAANESVQPRTPGSTNVPIGQMTIFYCGKVNVYDDVPADKVRALMHIAASPLQFPDEQPVDSTAGLQPVPCLPKVVSSSPQDSAALILSTLPTVKINESTTVPGEENRMLREETHVEGQSVRKASVQRYLEKRKKDRFKSKGKAGTTSCASLDVYINHQMGNQLPRIDTSITQIRKPSNPTRCSSMENDPVKKICLSTGLSNKGV